LDTAYTVMVNEPGPARDSTLAFTKGVVDVDLALPVFVYYRSPPVALLPMVSGKVRDKTSHLVGIVW
jgi:hypothetical protein